MKKVLAGFLYVAYAAFMIFAICFAEPYYSDLYDIITGDIANITDVEMTAKSQGEMIIGKYYSFEYSVIGEYKENAGLRFQSLDTDKLYVSSRGVVLGIDNGEESDYITARMRIYSAKDEDFEKVVTLTFKRVYPAKFSAEYYVHSVGENVSKAYLGYPINLYSTPASGQSYSVKTYELVYDSEYFRYDEEKKLLIPIKATPAGEKITLGVRYANGASVNSREFVIMDAPEFSGFDEVRCNGKTSDGYSIKQDSYIALSYYKDGKKQIVNPTVTFAEGEGGAINKNGEIYFKTTGEKHVTLSVGDEFTKEIVINVKDRVVLPEMRTLDDALYGDNTVSINYYDTKSFSYSFGKNYKYRTMEFEYDESIITVTDESGIIKITPKDLGQTTLKIYLDNGDGRVERTFTVEITGGKSTADQIKHYVSKNTYLLVTKIFGHMLLFAILAPICLLLAKTFEFESVLTDILFILITSVPLAALTEFIQSFVPGRSPTIKDVLIDMSGFLIGTILTFLIVRASKMSSDGDF